MRLLFIHQNFPGQYRHLFHRLAHSGEHQVVGMGEQANLARNTHGWQLPRNAMLMGYGTPAPAGAHTHAYLRGYEAAIRRGQDWARVALQLKKQGFSPDVVCVHPGWGEALFVREVFPRARVVTFCEFYYQPHGADFDFDPEYPVELNDFCALRIKNSVLNQALLDCDLGMAPTHWQKSVHPRELQHKLAVVHDGIDTRLLQPDPVARFILPDGRALDRSQPVVTFVNRNLEPYRGFHQFMRALPELQRLRPDAEIVIVGGDEVSYGRRVEGGYRAALLKELDGQLDLTRIHFVGKLPYPDYVRLLQVSAAHVYLTYPFVLSWSMLEAMALGCLVIGSATSPVQEVLVDGENGCLVDFFDPRALAERTAAALENDPSHQYLRQAARETVVRRYDLHDLCLPRQQQLILDCKF
ncbi:glycosyltransferase involved in cell wall biosynthesis [Pseudomonas fluvialis]|uniref:Glycosyltransferase involved in cell wall biosynthesis n=1 Tax=Pseudomonas fluvialis TaxID=1793966 RepID=A0A7X0ET18_9PSED|nr:glycosyltransferase family 4 protein [Pseudomonas fluvialis]MBB6340579.1 glycosyltransferase involved in cell wall biosynthesis [Pseudomonas fluvialis]